MDQYLIQQAVAVLTKGGVIAYPTEGVYGIGCDPFSSASVDKVRKIKSRPATQGFIIIAANWTQVSDLVDDDQLTSDHPCWASWPGPVTWLMPASDQAPYLITGDSDKIAVRLTAHPTASALCQQFGGPLVSTSANRKGEPPCTDAETTKSLIGSEVDMVLEGELSNAGGATPIWDAVTHERVR